jgi:integrase
LGPHFGEKPLARIGQDDVEEFVLVCLDRGQSVKSTRNYLGFLHGIFEFALRQGWVLVNPCRAAEKPAAPEADADIRFLDQAELDALLGATVKPHGRRKPGTEERSRRVKALRDAHGMTWKAIEAQLAIAESTAIYLYRLELDAGELDDALGRVDRALYLTAAMTGMRQGELFALRWMDVDWLAHRVRVRRNYVHGRFGTPRVQALVTEHPPGRPGGARARAAVSGVLISGR